MSARSDSSSAIDSSFSSAVPLLEHRVAEDRDAAEPREHVGEVRGLAAVGALLGLLQLGDERAHRRHAAEPLEPPPHRLQRQRRELRVAGEVAERDDQLDLRPLVGVAEREVAHPATVGGDPVADAERQHEGAHRRRGEQRLRHLLRRGGAGRVRELVALVRAVLDLDAEVGGEHDELDRRALEPEHEVERRLHPLRDRARKRVVVEPEQRQPPEPVRTEDVLRAKREEEPLEVVEAVERRHDPGERAGRGPEDPADPRPELALAHPAQEAELHHRRVDAPTGEDERDIASSAVAHPH